MAKQTNVKKSFTGTRTSASQYVKNVGKSIGFYTIQSLGENASGIESFLKENEEFFKETYSSVKNFRANLKKSSSSIKDNKLFQALEYGVKNLLEDIKTGKFYDHRESDAVDAIGLGDDEDDYNWDDSGDYSWDDSSTETATKELSNNFSKVMNETTAAQSSVTAKGINMVIKGQEASTKYLMAQMDKVGQTIHAGIGSVYVETNSLNKFMQGPMTAHLQNSKIYYENSIRIAQEQHQMIKEMLDMQKKIYGSANSSYNREETALDNIFRVGSFNLKEYFGNVKKNIKQTIDDFTGGILNIDLGEGSNPFMLMMANPMSLILSTILGNDWMPKRFKNSVKSFDKTISNVFAQAIARMNKEKDKTTNGFLELLFNILGVDIEKKKDINTARYERGAVPFDGIVRKSIVEVIPGYLSRIEAALTGSSQRHYDYNTGSWKSAEQIKRDFEYEKSSIILQANYELRNEIESIASATEKTNKRKANKIRKAGTHMINKIFEDEGDFRINKKTGKPDYEYYGNKYLSEEDYDALVHAISRDAFKTVAFANMQANQNLSKKYKDIENNPDSAYRVLFDDTYADKDARPGRFADPTKYKASGSGILASSHDGTGKNIFSYLREIISVIKSKSFGGDSSRRREFKARATKTNTVNSITGSATSTTEGSGDDDPDPDDGDDDSSIEWARFTEEREKAKKEQETGNAAKFKKWVSDKFGNSPFGKLLQSTLGLGAKLLEKPFDYAADLLDKADRSITGLIFGENELKDREGNPIKSIFDYIIIKIKDTFSDLRDWFKKTFKDNLWEPFKKFWNPRWEKYGKPMVDAAKDIFRAGGSRVKQGLDNTLGLGFNKVKETLSKGGVASADDVAENAAEDNGTVPLSARGRLVTKRGLTMISPGEIIIPASFDKKEQNKMLALEKRDRKRISDIIDLNAGGNVDEGKLKTYLRKIYEENTGKISKIGGGGIVGAGAGLLAGINPLLGAAAGAGISIISNSETAKTYLFGDENQEGGLFTKKFQNKVKKYLPDAVDYGIAGGVLGLFTPFGLIGGAAIGTGISLLKNNETVKKYLFGDENEDGLISKENQTKIQAFFKKAVPSAALGAGIGILTGPFGIIGNAAVGAGVGLLSSTKIVHKLLFGQDGDEDDEIFGDGLVGAVKNGILLPAKEKFSEVSKSFKDSIHENMIKPLKNFWVPFQQILKNAASDITEGIKSGFSNVINDIIGSPLADYLQERVFKPTTKFIGGALKLPVWAAKKVVFAPFKAAGKLGTRMQRGLIRKGRAFNMSAKERIQYIKDNPSWNPFKDTRYREQDEFLANLDDSSISNLSNHLEVFSSSKKSIEKSRFQAKSKLNDAIFKYFKKNIGYDKVSNKNVAKLSKFLQEGNSQEAQNFLVKLGLTDQEISDFLDYIEPYVKTNETSIKNLGLAGKTKDELNAYLTETLGKRVSIKTDSERSRLLKTLKAEMKHRGIGSEFSTTEAETPETKAIGKLANIYEKKDGILDQFKEANKYLKQILGIEEEEAKKEEKASTSNPNNLPVQIDPKTGAVIHGDPDSKKNKERIAEEESDDAVQEEQLVEIKKTSLIMSKIKDVFLGEDRQEDDSVLTKVFKSIKSIGGFLLGGIGTGASIIGGVSLIGHLSQWFKTDIWPGLRSIMIGTEDKPGLFFHIANWFGEKITKVYNWWNNEGGLSGIMGKYVIEPTIAGLGYSMENIIAPLVGGLLKHLPSIIWGAVKGLVKGIFSFKDNNVIDESGADLSNNAVKELAGIHNQTNSKLNGYVSANTKSIFKSTIDTTNPYKTISQDAVNYIKENEDSWKYKNSATVVPSGTSKEEVEDITYDKSLGNLFGLLGNTRNNKVVYDEDGNRISDYTQYKENKNVLGIFLDKFNKQGLKSFLGGNKITPIKLFELMGNIDPTKNFKRLSFGRNKIANLFDAVVGTAKTGLKLTGNVASAGSSAGKFMRTLNLDTIRRIFDPNEVVDDAAGAAEKTKVIDKIKDFFKNSKKVADAAETVGEVAEKPGLIKRALNAISDAPSKLLNLLKTGITKLFDKIATSKIIRNFAMKAAKAVGKNFTEEAAEKVLKKAGKEAGEKLGKKLLKQGAKLTGKVAGKIATKIGYLAGGIGIAIDIGFAIFDFKYGWDNADTMFGVAKDDPNVEFTDLHRFIAGCANMTNEYLAGIIPKSWITSVLTEVYLPIYGLDNEDIKIAQENAKNILDEYNAQNPDNTVGSLEEYNKLGRDGVFTQIKNWFAKMFEKKEKATNSVRVADSGGTTGGSGRITLSGGARNSIKQNSIYASMPYGNSTIGKSGCAPVSIVNLLQNMGINANVPDAAAYALQNGYVLPNGSTDINYFNSYLSDAGIASYTTTNKNRMYDAIRSGKNVILLGKDSYNGSGAPFGSNPHYITATGVDANGNIIVEDPGLAQNTVKYSKSKLFNSTIASVIAGAGEGENTTTTDTEEENPGFASKLTNSLTSWLKEISRRIYGSKYDSFSMASTDDEENTTTTSNGILGEAYEKRLDRMATSASKALAAQKQNQPVKLDTVAPGVPYVIPSETSTGADAGSVIWNMLKGYGYTPQGIAAIMGNLYAESGLRSNNLENVFNNKLGITDEDYTDAVNKKIRSKSSFEQDSAGYGLAQWTYHTRKKGLYDRTVELGKSIDDIASQVEYLDYELKNEPAFKSLHKLLKSTDNISTASDKFLKEFENPANKNYDERRAFSKDMYSKYSGSGRSAMVTGDLSRTSSRRSGMARATETTSTNINYQVFLESIITILMTIADNTALLTKILDVLSENTGSTINKEEVKAIAKENNQNARKALSKLLNNAGVGNIGEGGSASTKYIFDVMSAIAHE